VETSGDFTLQIAGFVHPPAANVQFAGSDATVYRLLVTTGPYVSHAFPAGLQRGRKATLELAGWNLDDAPGLRQREFDVAESEAENAFLSLANGVRLALPIDDLPEQLETEPNNAATNAQPITPPVTINGRIDPTGDEDRYVFAARKGESLEILV